MKTKETWIYETMDALDGITRAESDPVLGEKALQRIHQNQLQITRLQRSLIWKIAACIAVLISINIFSLVYLSRSANGEQDKVKSVASEYFSYIDSYNLWAMKKTTIYQIIIILLIVINVGSLSFIWLQHPGREKLSRPPSAPEFLIKELNLTGPQRNEFFRLRNNHRSILRQLEIHDKILHQQFFDILLLDIPDTVRMHLLADSIAANRKQMELVTYEHFFNITKMLSPEQQKKFGIIFHKVLRMVLPPPPPPPDVPSPPLPPVAPSPPPPNE
jgi:hypothetical protein